jgi:hypothetical protein
MGAQRRVAASGSGPRPANGGKGGFDKPLDDEIPF